MMKNIVATLKDQTRQYARTPFLSACKDKSLSLSQFNEVALVRFGTMAPLLEKLLHKAISLSQKTKNNALLETLKDSPA